MTRTVLITGATSGFGAAAVHRFAQAGWKVIATGRRGERLQPLVERYGKDVVHAAAFDIRDPVAMEAALLALPPAFGEIDLLLTPTNQVEAFPADWASPLNDPQRPFEHIVFTVPWNMGEQPALSINCGFTAAGMPIGLQLVAPRFADTWLLRIGKTYEGWRGPIHGWPRPPAD